MSDLTEDFVGFSKIPRLTREMIITEKLDGTNAQVVVYPDGRIRAGSRNRWISPESDNYGFARWVSDNEADLRDGLGVGRHFGEWWGAGIQRRYGLSEKRFSLFNVGRWELTEPGKGRPSCCHVVPVLYRGPFDSGVVDAVLKELRTNGSKAAPGFMNPEGVVVFHAQSGGMYKKTIDAEDVSKFAVGQ